MNIAVIGAGGIGSFFIETVNDLIESGQLPNCGFICFDDDIVEVKNIKYQNFNVQDVGDYKVDALANRYLSIDDFVITRVCSQDLITFDLVIICADNNLIRRDVYKLYTENGIKFIDSRSNGRAIGIYSSICENYLDTLSDDNDSHSCQHPYQIAKDEIELGNRIVSQILAQKLLRFVRKNELPREYTHIF